MLKPTTSLVPVFPERQGSDRTAPLCGQGRDVTVHVSILKRLIFQPLSVKLALVALFWDIWPVICRLSRCLGQSVVLNAP